MWKLTAGILVLLMGPTHADGWSVQQHIAAKKYHRCTTSAAFQYGSKSCHAPSELVPAVIGHCRSEWDDFVGFINSNEEARITKDLIHKDMEPYLHRIIIDAQIQQGCS